MVVTIIKDQMTKPISRVAIRQIATKCREIFGAKPGEPFPVLESLERLCVIMPNTHYEIVEDDELPGDIFAGCSPKPEGGYLIQIKQTIYDGAYEDNNAVFLSFIAHEISHAILFWLGYTPISARSISDNVKIPAYCSVEWQAKALCGEILIPFYETEGMKTKEIVERYNVPKDAARYRVKKVK